MTPRTFPVTPMPMVVADLQRRWRHAVELSPREAYLGRNQIFEVLEPHGILKLFQHEGQTRVRREVSAYRLLKEHGLAVPQVLDHGQFPDGTPWLFMQLMPGRRMEDIQANIAGDQLSGLYDALGHFIARMHATPVTNTSPFAYKPPQQRFEEARATVLAREFSKRRVYEAAAETNMRIAEIPVKRLPCLVHRDASSRNVLVDDSHGEWRMEAVIDFELAILGDPMEDLAKLALKEFRRSAGSREAFLNGYNAVHISAPDDDVRFRYHLIALVFDIGRWAMDDDPAFFQQATDVLEAIMDNDPLFCLPARSATR
jgi:aminoglycoside phosphotransferase (APT) family kinase protein